MAGGIATAAALWQYAVDIGLAQLQRPTQQPPRWAPLSPWASAGQLSRIDFNPDVFGFRPGPVTPDLCMRCAPLKKGRALLHSLIDGTPLVAIRTDGTGTDTVLTGSAAPTWTYRTDTEIPPQRRTAMTLDDLIFFEAAVWAVRRGPAPLGQLRGPILDAAHLPYELWRIGDSDLLEVDAGNGNWVPVDPDSVVYIAGPSRGICLEAQDEVRQWRTTAANINQRLTTPVPSFVLTDPDAASNPMDDGELDELMAQFNAARRSPTGAAMYAGKMTAQAIQANDDANLYIGFRNSLRLDFANHLNLPSALLDGSPSTASLTYSTKDGARDELADLSLNYWTDPIEAALSQDAVVPRGTRIRFNFAGLFAATNAATGDQTQD